MTKNYIKKGIELLILGIFISAVLSAIVYFSISIPSTIHIKRDNNPNWQLDTPLYYKEIMKKSVLRK